jgi:hypothetical protein
MESSYQFLQPVEGFQGSEATLASLDTFVPKLSEYLRCVYRLEVSIERLPNNAQAIFDGTHIRLSEVASAEKQAFIVLHLAGHAVQLATLPEWREADAEIFNLRRHPQNEAMIRAYELDASTYGVGLLLELGKPELVPWFEKLAAIDLEYFIHFCKTGSSELSDTLLEPHSVSIPPRLLPLFEPIRVKEITIV